MKKEQEKKKNLKKKDPKTTQLKKEKVKDLDVFDAEAERVHGGAYPPDPCRSSRGC